MSHGPLLILGGAGMVGLQVAREAIRELRPARVILSALKQSEIDAVLPGLREEAPHVEILGEPGDLFLPQSLQGKSRRDIPRNRADFELLFEEIFSRDPNEYRNSSLFQLMERHKPDVVVDCINTATAISYQDEFKASERVNDLLRQIDDRTGTIARADLQPLIDAVRELLVAQGVPQITRHILFLHRALEQSSVRVYVKIGTTGTGGMGINIPYTHSEDKPSLQLLAKSAIGFAHTGLLFLLARTPSDAGTIVKEIKPGAMIGFKRLTKSHIKTKGAAGPLYLMNTRDEELGTTLDLLQPADGYGRFEGRDVPVEIIGADTGENGFFSIGEFRAITYPRQMEYVTPEEVARTAILEILGASTGRDVLSAIDGAITEPSYRAGFLRDLAVREMERLEAELGDRVLPSIAVGDLGPPKLSKLLAEAYLVRAAAGEDIDELRRIAPAEMQRRVEEYLAANPRIVSLITTIGVPILRERNGRLHLTRGPRVSIPALPTDGSVVALTPEKVAHYARTGWVDLRLENFETWHRRLCELEYPDIAGRGSAAFDIDRYPGKRFAPGDVVGWLLTKEIDEQGMAGHRLF